ncbi:hypothetical protein Rhe02_05360 [Rhizocola hellebori]|uniref:Trypsin-like serine protease n=1 Tax=Rhizocola hellebori TaxID=1392758 RepID=A0A8J3VCE2_9ACTN|nr:hypothetical protein Rhe02_05360 [Rhizocola hellebori]
MAISTLLVASHGFAAPAVAAVPSGKEQSIRDRVPGGFASWGDLFTYQGVMNQGLAEIVAAGQSAPFSGFGNAIAAPESRQLVIYWKGEVPSQVLAAVETVRQRVPVKLLPAKYTRQELAAAVLALSKHPEIVEAAPQSDASGVSVTRRKGAASTVAAQDTVRKLGVAVSFGPDRAASHLPFSRQDDKAKWSAGGRTAKCTTGFAVKQGGREKLLSAAHCALNDGEQVVKEIAFGTANPTMYVGTLEQRSVARDVGLIHANGGSKGGMWDGPYLSTQYKIVSGATPSVEGNWLCTSGAVSGVLCGLRVTQILASNGPYFPLVRADQVNGLTGGGEGDSGGPVFELPNPDNGTVIAKGIFQGGDRDYAVACAGQVLPRECSSRIYYADVIDTLDFYGASICKNLCPSNRTDLSGDGLGDLTFRLASTQNLYLNKGNGNGGLGYVNTQIGNGWQDTQLLIAPGDFSGDGLNDLVFRKPSNMGLYMITGNGSGGWTNQQQQIGSGWQDVEMLTSAGDFSGDGKPDVLYRRISDKNLYMVRGNGTGGWITGASEQIGTGWYDMDMIIASSDFSGDGKPDVLYRRTSNQNLYMIRGNGAGGWITGASEQIGTLFYDMDMVLTPDDFSGDGKADLVYRRTSNKNMYLIRGNGSGGWITGTSELIGTSWQGVDLIAGASNS